MNYVTLNSIPQFLSIFNIYVILILRIIIENSIIKSLEQVKNESDVYARNFLFPKNLAVEANNENMSKLKAKQDSAKYQKNQEKEEAMKIADKLSKISLKIKVKAGGNGKIFGGVSSKEIAQELKEQYNITVDKKKIELKETIKELGVRNVEIKLFEGVIGKVKIDVISE